MPHIAREDGEHFVIPAYRDTLSVKKDSLLKREAHLLAEQHGEFIALQRKNAEQYEIAFSNEAGYLLGESVWHYFQRPNDLIYCEALAGTTQAVLVVVTGGSVYLDGSFPIDSIADELVILRTQQQHHFDIYIYGDVPIAATLTADKFALDAAAINSFTVLDQPLFPVLPKYRQYRLDPVDVALASMGIGVLPIKKMVVIGAIIVALVGGWYYVTNRPPPITYAELTNPYQAYLNTLAVPDAGQQLAAVNNRLAQLYTAPGWQPASVSFSSESRIIQASMKSTGMRTHVLFAWATANNATVTILPEGLQVALPINVPIRTASNEIMPLQQVMATLIDNVSYVVPGNPVTLAAIRNRGNYSSADLTLNFSNMSPSSLDLLAKKLQGLPLVLSRVNITIREGVFSGNIILQALGS